MPPVTVSSRRSSAANIRCIAATLLERTGGCGAGIYLLLCIFTATQTAPANQYVPAGFISHTSVPTPTDAAVTFFYPRLGQLTNVTLAVFHVANFHLSEEGQRVRIGNIGGPGGSAGGYRHSHIEFYSGNTGLPSPSARIHLRIDPAIVFEVTQAAIAKAGALPAGYGGY